MRELESGRKRRLYSEGQLNRLIDSLLHPLFNRNPELMMVDTILHAIIEQNAPETVKKFLRYNLPRIITELTKNIKQ